ncbi:hypothetical protein G9A89_007028 [Geosiphon pyriformis]|nr:hypothetical protein G9A89_007028 [Geosiphon pyriformis]
MVEHLSMPINDTGILVEKIFCFRFLNLSQYLSQQFSSLDLTTTEDKKDNYDVDVDVDGDDDDDDNNNDDDDDDDDVYKNK